MAFCAPLNLLVAATDSVMVLLFPSIRSVHPGDVLASAKVGLVMMVKFLSLFAGAALAGLPALVVYLLAGPRPLAMAISSWIVLVLEGAAVVLCASILFERFDPSTDTTERA